MNELVNVSEVISLPTGNKDAINLNYNIIMHKRKNQHIFLNDIINHKNIFINECENCAIYINRSSVIFNNIILIKSVGVQIYLQNDSHFLRILCCDDIKINAFSRINQIQINTSLNILINSFSKLLHRVPIMLAGGFDIYMNIIDKEYIRDNYDEVKRLPVKLLCNMFYEGFLTTFNTTTNKIYNRKVILK